MTDGEALALFLKIVLGIGIGAPIGVVIGLFSARAGIWLLEKVWPL